MDVSKSYVLKKIIFPYFYNFKLNVVIIKMTVIDNI